jgi:hypothetical protein
VVVAEEPKSDTQACYSMTVLIVSCASWSTCPDARPFVVGRAFASLAAGVGGRGGRASYTTAPRGGNLTLKGAEHPCLWGRMRKTPHFAVYVSTVLALCS